MAISYYSSNYLVNLKNELVSKNLIKTLHYETGTSLVVELTIFPGKVLSFKYPSNYLQIALGDSYTGNGTTDAISSSMQVVTYQTDSSSYINTMQIVTTNNLFALFVQNNQVDKWNSMVIFKAIHNEIELPCLFSFSSEYWTTSSANHFGICITNNRKPIDFLRLGGRSTPIYNESGEIMQMELILKNDSGYLLPHTNENIKILLTPTIPNNAGVTVLGDDIAMPMGNYMGLIKNAYNSKLLLKNAAL